MKMTFKEISREVSEDLQMSQKKAEIQVKAIMDCIGENIAAGHEIVLPGFGKFKTNHRPAREARNPKTGEMVKVSAKSVPKFLPAKQLKDACNEHNEE